MTTAVAPANAMNWSEVFSTDKGFPDEGPHWRVINDVLYNIALAGRFGFVGMPHDFKENTNNWSHTECDRCDKPRKEHPIELSLTEQVVLAVFRSWSDNNEIKNVRYNSRKWNKIVREMGTSMLMKCLIANADPRVGHFVGRGFDQNEKDADRFLGNG
jgi:hypothetical protein